MIGIGRVVLHNRLHPHAAVLVFHPTVGCIVNLRAPASLAGSEDVVCGPPKPRHLGKP